MQQVRNMLKKYFFTLTYFYSHLGYRIVIIFMISFLVGLMDGLGLTMFIPLLESVSGNETTHNSDQMGNLAFVTKAIEGLGFDLNLITVLAIMLFFFVFKGIFKFFEQYLNAIYRQYFISNLRIDSIRSLSNLDFEYFMNMDIGRIQNTITGEVGRVVIGFNTYMLILQQMVLLIVYAILALIANPEFAVLVTIGVFFTNIIFNKLYKITKKLSRKLTSFNHSLQSLIIQQVAQFKYLKATGKINVYAEKVIKEVRRIEQNQRKMGFISAITSGLREPIIMLLVVLSIFIQINLMGGNIGSIILSILFFYRALSSIMQIQTSWNKYLELSGSFENLKTFINELKNHKGKTGNNTYQGLKKEITLSNLSFSYGDRMVLKDINLEIRKNQTIALVGESGSGKTTLVNILTGLLRPKQGNYYIDGVNITDLNNAQLQQHIGYITQEPVIFNDTIYNNVTFWAEKNEYNLGKFYDVLRKADIYNFVNELSLKEDSELGNNGINISGGQKQRLSIARELFKGAEIIMLDEATSALDSQTERKIQESFEQLKGNYTLIIIAHRLSTIKNADRIVVLVNGEIQNIGTFDELIKESVVFNRMVEMQNL